MKTINTDHHLFAVKKAANDDIIVAAFSGLFLTNENCSLWTKIADGQYCDVFIHGNKFSALRHDTLRVVTHHFVKEANSRTKNWTQQAVIDLPQAYFVHDDETDFNSLALESNDCITVANNDKRLLCIFDNKGVLQKVHGIKHWEPVVCGVDKSDRILVVNAADGKLYATNNLQHLK